MKFGILSGYVLGLFGGPLRYFFLLRAGNMRMARHDELGLADTIAPNIDVFWGTGSELVSERMNELGRLMKL
jgi:hypothetical protein